MKINSIAKLVILALLDKGPLHGYEIIKEVEKKTSLKLSASHIYPFLKELKKNSFVMEKHIESKKGHDKNIYLMTQKGKKFYSSFMERFSVMLESGIKNNITKCHHCSCEIYKNHYYESINGKMLAFCCSHCADSFKHHQH